MVTMAQRIEALRTEAGLARVPASLERLHAYADQFQAKGSPELVEEIGGKAFLPPPFRP